MLQHLTNILKLYCITWLIKCPTAIFRWLPHRSLWRGNKTHKQLKQPQCSLLHSRYLLDAALGTEMKRIKQGSANRDSFSNTLPWKIPVCIVLIRLCLLEVAAERVAVCISGRIRAIRVTGETQRRNFYDPLCGGSCEQPKHTVDVFMAGPLQSNAQLEAAASMFPSYPWLVKAVRFHDESAVLQHLIATFPKQLQEALQIGGNWLGTLKRRIVIPGTHRIQRRSGPGIFALWVYKQCLEMIEAHEELLSLKYDRMVLTRTDLQWDFPHPHLDDLPLASAWIPDTLEDDWGGLYDRHILFPRWAAKWVLGGWFLLTSGRAFPMILDLLGSRALSSNTTNTEVFLAIRLLTGEVPIARFPATAYLACDVSEWRTPTGAAGGDSSFHGSRSTNFACEPGGYRYPKEWASVQSFSECFRSHESRPWSRAVQECYCPHIGHDVRTEQKELYQICDGNAWRTQRQQRILQDSSPYLSPAGSKRNSLEATFVTARERFCILHSAWDKGARARSCAGAVLDEVRKNWQDPCHASKSCRNLQTLHAGTQALRIDSIDPAARLFHSCRTNVSASVV